MWISSLWIPSVQHLSWAWITWQDIFFFGSIATLPCFKSPNSQVNMTLGRSLSCLKNLSYTYYFSGEMVCSEWTRLRFHWYWKGQKSTKSPTNSKLVTKTQFCANVCGIFFLIQHDIHRKLFPASQILWENSTVFEQIKIISHTELR